MSHIPRQWVTALDLNFASQANQTLGTNTTFTIGGLTWTKINSSGDATAMAISNGNGLVITPTSSSNINTSTFSSPALLLPITSIIPSFTPFMPVRVWIYISSSNEAANNDNVSYGILINNSGYTNQLTLQTVRGFTGSQNGWACQYIVLQSNITESSITVPQTARVGVSCYSAGIFSGNAVILTGTFSSGWPTYNTLDLALSPTITASASAALASSSSGAQNISAANLYISALRAGSGTSFVATIARFRVDYLPLGN